MTIEVGQVHQAAVLNRHQHGVRGAMLLREFEEAPRIEFAHQHDSAASY